MVILSLPSHCLRSVSRRLRAPFRLFCCPLPCLSASPPIASVLSQSATESLIQSFPPPLFVFFVAPAMPFSPFPPSFPIIIYRSPSLPYHFPAPSQPLGARFSRFPAKSPMKSPEMALKTAVLTGFAKSVCEIVTAFHKKVRFFCAFPCVVPISAVPLHSQSGRKQHLH